MYIYNAEIITMERDNSRIPYGFVRVEKGKIAEISCGSPEKISEEDIDADGTVLMPGFIDIHTHMGFIGDGAGEEGIDVNEGSDPVMPQLRSVDGINFRDGYFADAVKAGVTSVVTGVGSLNPIGGDMLALKTAARCLDEAVIMRSGIKFALGENPKSYYTERDEAPQTRMATAALIREALEKAKRYGELLERAEEPEDRPDYDIKCEALLPLLRGELKAHFHCHRADDIMTALRICDEFGLDPLLVHCTEGHLIADILGEKGAMAVVGPIICDRGKPELANASLENAAKLYKAGVKVAICTDHPENPINFLTAGAAYCHKYGLPKEEALRAITVTAAELGGFGDRTGSISVGKDADLILLSGDPFEIQTDVLMTMINGKIYYERK
ncbi:amidohydrolase [Huintestinicola sp.]|uniref:amidohydrolase n=1 Tax=Huintestinicola sp. TaxID=2981661 RepID=UPI003D7E3F28